MTHRMLQLSIFLAKFLQIHKFDVKYFRNYFSCAKPILALFVACWKRYAGNFNFESAIPTPAVWFMLAPVVRLPSALCCSISSSWRMAFEKFPFSLETFNIDSSPRLTVTWELRQKLQKNNIYMTWVHNHECFFLSSFIIQETSPTLSIDMRNW